jgi:hypothetical protein
MLQRIQTLYLIVVIISSAALFFLPLISFVSDLFYLKLYLYEFRNLTPDSEIQFSLTTVLPMLVINAAVIVLAVFTISKFKNRILQVRLVRFTLLLSILMIVGIFVLYPNIVMNNTEAISEFEVGAYIPIINLLFLFLANRSILKDEKLVRSMDRIR